MKMPSIRSDESFPLPPGKERFETDESALSFLPLGFEVGVWTGQWSRRQTLGCPGLSLGVVQPLTCH